MSDVARPASLTDAEPDLRAENAHLRQLIRQLLAWSDASQAQMERMESRLADLEARVLSLGMQMAGTGGRG